MSNAASLVDDRTRAIVVNNPSNPCGSVYSRDHLQEIVDFAHRNRLPIIADEIYDDMVFADQSFVPIAEVSSQVPVLAIGGISKKYVAPGWRLGWVIIHDREDRFREVSWHQIQYLF